MARLRTNKGAAWVELALRNQGAGGTQEPPSPACLELMQLRGTAQWSELLEEPRAYRLELLDLSYCDYVSHDALVAVLRASWLARAELRVRDYYGEYWRVRLFGDIKQCATANEPRSPFPEREELEEMKAAAERRELEEELEATTARVAELQAELDRRAAE